MNGQEQNNMFASKIGAILAAAGSAVGLGNVWRFPTETGSNGGAAFILIYVFFMFLMALPIMVTEIVIGRHGQSSVSNSFMKMSGGKRVWRYMGLIPLVAGILILSYYAVVAGWTLYYSIMALLNQFSNTSPEGFADGFAAFSSDPVNPLGWMWLFILVTAGIVALGVQKGIERGSKIMMPLLFIFIVILMFCSLTLPNASDGLRFLFKPDFSKVTGYVVLSAMGQAFFSLSVGIGCLCTYACYFRKDVNIIKDSFSIASIDTLVALFSGIIIFPAVYSIPGLQPDAGPSLVFITLPNVFQQVFGGSQLLAYFSSLVFYLLLVMAALTSSISMLEMPVAYIEKSLKWSRPKTAFVVGSVCMLLGTLCSLSFGILSDFKILGMDTFSLFDYLVAKFIMPIGSMLMCIFLGWVVDEKVLKAELTNNGTISVPLYGIYRFIIRYFAPICIALIFLNELGFFSFLKK